MVFGFCLSIYCKEKYCDITIYHSNCSIREVNCSIRAFRSFAGLGQTLINHFEALPRNYSNIRLSGTVNVLFFVQLLPGIWIQWNGMVGWNSGMEWNGGMKW